MSDTLTPWIWLQVEETFGKADACACRLDAGGPDGDNSGAAFYMCPLHEAAADLLAACKETLPAIRWGMTHQFGNLSQWRDCEQLLLAAIAKATGPQAQ